MSKKTSGHIQDTDFTKNRPYYCITRNRTKISKSLTARHTDVFKMCKKPATRSTQTRIQNCKQNVQNAQHHDELSLKHGSNTDFLILPKSSEFGAQNLSKT